MRVRPQKRRDQGHRSIITQMAQIDRRAPELAVIADVLAVRSGSVVAAAMATAGSRASSEPGVADCPQGEVVLVTKRPLTLVLRRALLRLQCNIA